MSRLGAHIKRLRENAGLSLQEVADRAMLSKAHIWEIETGNSTNASIKTLCCIAVALDCLPDELTATAVSDCMDKLRVGSATHKFILPAAVPAADLNTPMGPNECPNCPGQHHWPHQCENTPEKRGHRELALSDAIATLSSDK